MKVSRKFIGFWYRFTAILLSSLLVYSMGSSQELTEAKTYQIIVNADGSFSPAKLKIRDGDTVEWLLNSRINSIIPAASKPPSGACPTPKAYDLGDLNNFTGPSALAPSGIFTLSPLERGLKVEQGRCSQGFPQATVGNNVLCPTGELQATMDTTWKDPNLTGVFIRLLWSQIQPALGTYDFTILDREIEKAVKNGKIYSLGIKAGKEGTPDWIFSTNADDTPRPNGGGGVKRLHLQDSGSEGDDGDEPGENCGVKMDLGSPTDPRFQSLYFEMLTKVAEHIKTRADWYRALVYIKPSGANLFSHENRLPKRCLAGCICNTQVLAESGYTPTGLYEFYRKQFDLLATLFPGKAMSYALIQAGFPLINDTGGWERADGTSSNGAPLPRGTEQTETILDMGTA